MFPLYININVISNFMQVFVQKFQIALESYWYTLIKSKLLQSIDVKQGLLEKFLVLSPGTSGAGKSMTSQSWKAWSLAAPTSFCSGKPIVLVSEYIKKQKTIPILPSHSILYTLQCPMSSAHQSEWQGDLFRRRNWECVFLKMYSICYWRVVMSHTQHRECFRTGISELVVTGQCWITYTLLLTGQKSVIHYWQGL